MSIFPFQAPEGRHRRHPVPEGLQDDAGKDGAELDGSAQELLPGLHRPAERLRCAVSAAPLHWRQHRHELRMDGRRAHEVSGKRGTILHACPVFASNFRYTCHKP